MADVANNVGPLRGVVGKRHFFVAALGAEQEAAASAITTRNPTRERSHAFGSHACLREGVW